MEPTKRKLVLSPITISMFVTYIIVYAWLMQNIIYATFWVFNWWDLFIYFHLFHVFHVFYSYIFVFLLVSHISRTSTCHPCFHSNTFCRWSPTWLCRCLKYECVQLYLHHSLQVSYKPVTSHDQYTNIHLNINSSYK